MTLRYSDTNQHDALSDEWRISINDDRYTFARYANGRVVEIYRSVGQAEAAVWAVAITQGYEPPRDLRNLEIPAD